jgi:hypothetical protein
MEIHTEETEKDFKSISLHRVLIKYFFLVKEVWKQAHLRLQEGNNNKSFVKKFK